MRPLSLPLTGTRSAGALLATVALLAGCGGASAEPAAAPAGPSSPSPAAASPAAPTPPAPKPAPVKQAVSPLTGTAPVPITNVVAVKIDNSPLARPFHRGLDEAALMYQELMEGGSTRFLAVYAPATGNQVGPVRSLREGDIELLQQFGKVAVGASGANAGVLDIFRRAEQNGIVLDVSYDTIRTPYIRAEKRRDAYNFYTSPERIDQTKPSGTKVKDIGLRFGPLPAGAGLPAPTAGVSFSPLARVTVSYDAPSGRYAVFQDGDRMKGYTPTNVVVQHTQIRSTAFKDVLGNATPYTDTVGKGAVTVLRDGRRLSGTWRRLAPHSGTRFLDDNGRDLPLKPGPTLVLLVPAGSRLSVG